METRTQQRIERFYAEDERILGQAPIFGELEEGDLARLAAGADRRTYGRRAVVLRTGSRETAALLLGTGTARQTREAGNGRTVTVAELAPGDLLGFAFLGASFVLPGSVQILSDRAIVYRIARCHMDELRRHYPSIDRSIMEMLFRRLAVAHAQVEDLACLDIHTRLLRILARKGLQNERHLVPDTHEELAALAGTGREQVSRHVLIYRDRGLIESPLHQKGTVVPDPARLLD